MCDFNHPLENSEGQLIASTAERISEFWQWFGKSIVVDQQGRPLVVYRGEHGACVQISEFQSRLGSLSFGSFQAAKIYALTPNNRSIDQFPKASRVFACYLRLERPAVNEPCDPYVEFAMLRQILGSQHLVELANDFSTEIMRTNSWLEKFDGFSSPLQVSDEAPDRLDDLYFLSYKLFDNAKWVERLSGAGFDGATHCGSGATACEQEYKVFHPNQTWRISRQMIDAR